MRSTAVREGNNQTSRAPMLVFPHCKVNLGLRVTARRPDGYHTLESIFYPLPVYDVMEAVRSEAVTCKSGGLAIPGEPADNLCLKAYQLLKADFAALPPLSIYLYKAIPIGAGLGGGSADAAFLLRLLNERFRLHLSDEKLGAYAARLGSDCAFFIRDEPALATGRGEILQSVTLADLSLYSWLLVCPPIHVATSWAYAQITPQLPKQSLQAVAALPVESWKGKLINDFEEPVCRFYPEIAEIRQRLYGAGAVYAAMSGSGAAVFGLFPKNKIAALTWEAGYKVFYIP